MQLRDQQRGTITACLQSALLPHWARSPFNNKNKHMRNYSARARKTHSKTWYRQAAGRRYMHHWDIHVYTVARRSLDTSLLNLKTQAWLLAVSLLSTALTSTTTIIKTLESVARCTEHTLLDTVTVHSSPTAQSGSYCCQQRLFVCLSACLSTC